MKQKLFFFAVVVVAMAFPKNTLAFGDFSAVSPSGHTLYYNIYGETAIVTYPYTSSVFYGGNYPAPTGDLVIPSSVTYNGVSYVVSEIGESAFSGCSGLMSVVIPNTVNSIGKTAFRNCTGLTELNIPTSVTEIGNMVFVGCSSLTALTIPNSVTEMGTSLFMGCSSLISVVLPSSTSSIGFCMFQDCSSLISVNIPESVTMIEGNAFENCSALTSITIPNAVTEIKYDAFHECSSLTEIYIPASVTSLGSEAFKGCTSLVTVTVAGNIDILGKSTFEGCTALTTVSLPESITQINQNAFQSCSSLMSLTLGDQVGTIGTYAFAGCTNLTLALSNAVTSIGNYAFLNVPTVYYCGTASGNPWGALSIVSCYTEDSLIYRDNTKAVLMGADPDIHVADIPASVVKIDAKAFINCSQLRTVTIPASVTRIGQEAFRGCSHLVSIMIPESVTYIGKGAFYSCGSLQSVQLPSQLETIEEETFRYSGIASITLPNALKTVKDRAFYYCGLTAITLPSSIETLGENAFASCGNLTTITIPKSLKQMGKRVLEGSGVQTVQFNAKEVKYTVSEPMFYGCESLQSVVLGDSVMRIPAYMFAGQSQLAAMTHLTLPPTIRYIGNSAFKGCSQMVSVTIPEYVDTIGQKLFEDCTGLKKVYFNARHAVSTGFADVPIEAYRPYTCGTLSYCNTSHPSVTYSLIDHIPAYDSIVIGPQVENIPDYAFGMVYERFSDGSRRYYIDSIAYYMTANTKVVNNSTKLRHIGDGAFGYLRVHTFDFGDSLKSIGIAAFIGTPIRKVFLPEGTESVANAAFNNCPSLDSVSLPSTLQELGTDCFARNAALRYLYYDCADARVWSFYEDISYSDSPFASTPNLHRVTFGPHVQHLNSELFANADGLDRFVVPEGVTSIGSYLFHMRYTTANTPAYSGYYPVEVVSSNLHYVELPASLLSIGERAFFNLPIDTVACRGAEPAEQTMAFNYTTESNSVLMIPCGSGETYGTTEEWMDFVNVVEYMPYALALTVNDEAMGTASNVCTSSQYEGHPGISLTATPAANHHFVQWSDGDTANPRLIFLDRDTALVAQFAWGNLYTITALSSNNNRGTVTGSGVFVQNTVDTLIATANYGYHFVHWNDGNTDNPRYLTVTASDTLTATFLLNQYTLTVQSGNVDYGSVSGGGAYNYNTSHPISATPVTGYHFVQWNDGDTTNPRSVRITRDTSFTAQFAINVYPIVVTVNNSVMGAASSDNTQYTHGDTATLTATANYGYHFVSWNDGNTDNPRRMEITQSMTVTAQFAANSYNVAGLHDTTQGTVSGVGSHDYLDTVILTANASHGYHFTQWTDGVTDNPRSFVITHDTAFTALFAKNSYLLVVRSNDSTVGEVTGGGVFEYLDTAAVTATVLQPHYHFVRWSDGSRQAHRNYVVTDSTVLTAVFALDTHHVTLVANDNSYGSLTGGGEYAYGAEAIITATAADGYHFAEWSNGSRQHRDTITVVSDTTLTALFSSNMDPTLCIVTVDMETGRNMLMWDKEIPVEHYNLYREGTVAGQYELIATVPYDAPSQWLDTSSRPMTRSYRYRISGTDAYGYESLLSDVHKTMHLTISQGIGNRWNLVWTEYAGVEYDTYYILRAMGDGGFEMIDEMPSGHTTYTDEEAPSGVVFYQVAVILLHPCGSDKAVYFSLSNVATNSTMGIGDIAVDNAIVYVRNGQIVVEGAEGNNVMLYDMAGRLLQTRRDAYNHLLLDVPAAGSYLVRIGNAPAHHVVVVK